MSCSSEKAAGAVGGKSARACDSCLRRRARWYCAADDAFLCQGCDTSVHSANPLARRHERLRLRASSPPPLTTSVEEAVAGPGTTASKRQGVTPAWSKRKARTRRPQVKSVGQLLSRRLVVPEMAVESSDERKTEEDGAHEEGQLLYRVPVFDPALAEFCSPPPIDDAAAASSSCFKEDADDAVEDTKYPAVAPSPVQQLPDSFVNIEPTDAELREFAADMEALLGQGLDDSHELQDSFYMETLGLITPVEESGRVKMEPDGVASNSRVSLSSCRPQPKPEEESADVLDIDFNCTSPTVADDDGSEQKSSATNVAATDAQFFQRSLDLRLNYEEIIESWGSSPWTNGRRPHGQLDDFWPNDHHYSGLWAAGGGGHGAEAGMTAVRPRMDGPGREARVTRYREKRRTRLFSKKIRYEVRKLNAEKRPRMKGRFVKRPPAAAAAAAPCAVT